MGKDGEHTRTEDPNRLGRASEANWYYAAAARVRPPRLPRGCRRRASLLLQGFPRLPVRAPAPATSAAPRVRLLPRLAAALFALASGSSRLRLRLRHRRGRRNLREWGGEARYMHGRRAALRARAGHRVAARALAVPSAA